MTAKEQLLQEFNQLSEDLAVEVLDFLLFSKTRRTQSSNVAPSPRPYALCANEFTVPDDFDAPLPDDILQDFENPDL